MVFRPSMIWDLWVMIRGEAGPCLGRLSCVTFIGEDMIRLIKEFEWGAESGWGCVRESTPPSPLLDFEFLDEDRIVSCDDDLNLFVYNLESKRTRNLGQLDFFPEIINVFGDLCCVREDSWPFQVSIWNTAENGGLLPLLAEITLDPEVVYFLLN
jgi:hypothetical protein